MLDRLSKHDRWWGLTHKDALVNWTKMSVEAALTNAIYGYTVMFAKLNLTLMPVIAYLPANDYILVTFSSTKLVLQMY